MQQITAAKDQETADVAKWKSRKHKRKNQHNADFDERDSIRSFQFHPDLSLPYNASLTLTIPNEHAPGVVGWRSYLPTSCNGVDDENDQDEPDLATPSGRALRRFQKVRADLNMLRLTFKTAVPEDIDERLEALELFIAEQNLKALTVYDEPATSNMFKMSMKVMSKDLKELVSMYSVTPVVSTSTCSKLIWSTL